MKVYKIRGFAQFISFILLTYGAYAGLRFKAFVPLWLCTNPSHYSVACYLLPLQNLQYGLLDMTTPITQVVGGAVTIPEFSVLWGKSFAYLSLFLSLIISAILFSKLWCGWFCPFGTLQDGISYLRKKVHVRESQFSEKMKKNLNSFKYIFLILLLIAPFMFLCGFKAQTPIFCKVCPARPLLSIFEGSLKNLGIGTPPGVGMSILTCLIAGITSIGITYRERFFCLFCPVAGFINIFRKIGLLKLEKNAHACVGCGNCWRSCPLDIKEVYLEEEKRGVMEEDCVLCLRCIESCPEDDTLFLKYLGKKIFSSSKKYAARCVMEKMR